jgi:hypothetical protein
MRKKSTLLRLDPSLHVAAKFQVPPLSPFTRWRTNVNKIKQTTMTFSLLWKAFRIKKPRRWEEVPLKTTKWKCTCWRKRRWLIAIIDPISRLAGEKYATETKHQSNWRLPNKPEPLSEEEFLSHELPKSCRADYRSSNAAQLWSNA